MGEEKFSGNSVLQLSPVCLANAKTLHSDTSVRTVDTLYQPRKSVFTVKSYQTCPTVLRNLLLPTPLPHPHPLLTQAEFNI